MFQEVILEKCGVSEFCDLKIKSISWRTSNIPDRFEHSYPNELFTLVTRPRCLENTLPCDGLVKRSATISSVNRYSILISFASK